MHLKINVTQLIMWLQFIAGMVTVCRTDTLANYVLLDIYDT